MKKIILCESAFSRIFEANTNKSLNKTRFRGNDEIYTDIDEVSEEMSHYKEEFVGKSVYCNCDDVGSAFYRYFTNNFSTLGLRLLCCTTMNNGGSVIVFDGVKERRGKLDGNGDMFSDECVDILDKCDIIVTNPPFSKIHSVIDLIVSHGKKYLIIGPVSALQKRHMDSVRNGEFGFGYKDPNSSKMRYSNTENTYGNHCWLTNLRGDGNKAPKTITNKYDADAYDRNDGGEYLIIDRGDRIPYDYDGIMAIPKTYVASAFNPQDRALKIQTPNGIVNYEIVGFGNNLKIGDKNIYDKILIIKK